MSTAIDDQQYKTDLESKDPNFVDVEEVEDDSSYTELTGWKKVRSLALSPALARNCPLNVACRCRQFYRGTLFQMIILGALSFCGPSMSDAISGLVRLLVHFFFLFALPLLTRASVIFPGWRRTRNSLSLQPRHLSRICHLCHRRVCRRSPHQQARY